jgi:hypothetical protein
MSATITFVDTVSLGFGNRESEFDVTLDTYSTAGITLDFSTWFHSRIRTVSIEAVEDARGYDYHQSHYWFEPRIVTRTSPVDGVRILAFRSANTAYDNDNAAAAGVAVYRDEDATGLKRSLFVSPTDTDCNIQGEQKVEIAADEVLTHIKLKIVVTGC